MEHGHLPEDQVQQMWIARYTELISVLSPTAPTQTVDLMSEPRHIPNQPQSTPAMARVQSVWLGLPSMASRN